MSIWLGIAVALVVWTAVVLALGLWLGPVVRDRRRRGMLEIPPFVNGFGSSCPATVEIWSVAGNVFARQQSGGNEAA